MTERAALDAIGGEDPPDTADPETTIAHLHRLLDTAHAHIEVAENDAREAHAALDRAEADNAQLREAMLSIFDAAVPGSDIRHTARVALEAPRAYEDADKVEVQP